MIWQMTYTYKLPKLCSDTVSEMVWYFIGVYIIWPLGDTKFLFECWKVFSTLEEKFRISKRPCNILYIRLDKWILSTRDTYPKGRRLRYVKPARPLYCNAAQGDIRWQHDRSLSLLLAPFCNSLVMILKQELTNLNKHWRKNRAMITEVWVLTFVTAWR